MLLLHLLGKLIRVMRVLHTVIHVVHGCVSEACLFEDCRGCLRHAT